MHREELTMLTQATCDHAKQRRYTQTRLDILNNFEIVAIKCTNCHKTLSLQIKKII